VESQSPKEPLLNKVKEVFGESKLESPKTTRKEVYEWVCFIRIIFGYLSILAGLIDFQNDLVNFLHAPIGVKDHPPEPMALVQFARLAFWPVLILYGALWLVAGFIEPI